MSKKTAITITGLVVTCLVGSIVGESLTLLGINFPIASAVVSVIGFLGNGITQRVSNKITRK